LKPAAGRLLAGCHDGRYYNQAAQGHFALDGRRRPIGDWLQDPDTPEALREGWCSGADAAVAASRWACPTTAATPLLHLKRPRRCGTSSHAELSLG